jgi:hypothetical protein
MENMEAHLVATIVFKEVFTRYGAPRVLVSDRVRNFMSKLVSALCEMFDIIRHHTSAYHPQTNATCERLNSTLEQILRAYVNEHQQNWPSILSAAMMAIRMSPATQSTGFSPFLMLFGKEMNLPVDTSLIPKTSMGMDAQCFFEQLLQNLTVAKEIAGSNMKIAQEKSKKRHDIKAKEPTFIVGDWVLLKNMRTKKGISLKLMHKHIGPYYISGLGPNFTYRLIDCKTQIPLKDLINASRIKKYVKPEPVRQKLAKAAQPAGAKKHDKQDRQGKAAFNERSLHPTQQQAPAARSPGGPQRKTGQGIRQSTGRQTTT